VGKEAVDPTVLIVVGVANLVLLIWFIVSVNRINERLRIIAVYCRRTALSLPLTAGQAKLINRGFTTTEIVALLEKHGAKLSVREESGVMEGGPVFRALVIANPEALDPELVALLQERSQEAVEFLLQRAGHA
jgi:hypothetical protein